MDIADANVRPDALRRVDASRASRRVFAGMMGFFFATCAGLTIVWCTSMPMHDMPMPGGWSLSMTWAPMCGQKWTRVAATFLGMWIVMMVAMMLPSLAPVLWRYHEAIGGTGGKGARRLTALTGVGYFSVWTVAGAVVFALGFALMTLALQHPSVARAVPVAASVVVMVAGVLQFSAWKARLLACSRVVPLRGASSPCMQGMRLGVHCIACCAGLTVVLLVHGTMDLRAMTLVTLAITAERLAPAPERMARAIGAVVVMISLSMFARAMGVL